MQRVSIAIDGPAGSGKSTIAKLISKRFGLSYVDTGAMYRGIGLLAHNAGISHDDEQQLTPLAAAAKFYFEMDTAPGSMLNRVWLNGTEVTEEIRAPHISGMASKVSALSGVRRQLVAMQKLMGAAGGVVMEGRDIGTVVMPAAQVKIFLTASPEVRANRRCRELSLKGIDEPREKVLAEIIERDTRDSTRADSPLKPAADAVHLDTSTLSIEQVVDRIAKITTEKSGIQG